MSQHPRASVSRRQGPDGWIEFARRPVDPRLRGLVAGRCGNEEHTSAAVVRRLPASSVVPVVISFGDPVEVTETVAGSGAGRSYGSFVAGLRAGHTLTRFSGEQAAVQVYLTPLGAQQILGVPGAEVSGRVLDLDLVAPRLAALAGPLADTPTWDERLDLVDRLLLELAAQGTDPDPVAGWMWRGLEATSGAARIAELSRQTGFSQRHVSGRFAAQVGLAPKTAARVLRFERAGSAIERGAPIADVAAAAGYADQSHLTREFVELAGVSPAAWAKSPPASPARALGSVATGSRPPGRTRAGRPRGTSPR